MAVNGIIAKKLASLDEHLLKLRASFEGVDLEAFRGDWVLQRMAERVLQVMVEIVIDVAERVVALHNAGPVLSSADAINKLVDLKVIRSAEPYVDMVKFRNFIVHQYEQVDPAIVFEIVSEKLDAFAQFRDEIARL